MSEDKIRGYRLSPQQRRVWRLQQLDSAWRLNAHGEMRINGTVDEERLKTALTAIVQRTEILRTVFVSVPGLMVPLQCAQQTAEVLWREDDLRNLDDSQKQRKLLELKREAQEREWDWTRGPLLAVEVMRLADQETRIFIEMPAVLADEAGLRNLIRAWQASYLDRRISGSDGAEEESVPYAAVAEWLNENLEDQSTEAGRQFWKQTMFGDKEVNLPWLTRTSSNEFIDTGNRRGIVPVQFDEALQRKIMADFGGDTQITAWLDASWRALLWRLTEQKRPVTGLVCEGRSSEELAEVIGILARHVPVAVEVDGNMKFSELLQRVSQAQDEARGWQDYFGWTDRADGQKWHGMCFEHMPEDEPTRDRRIEPHWEIAHTEAEVDRYDWKLVYREVRDGLGRLELCYDRAQWGEAEAVRLAASLAAVLASAAENPQVQINDLEVVGAVERRKLIEEFNHAGSGRPVGSRTLHQRFEEQAAQGPDRTAVIFEQDQVRYGDLNQRANRLAHYLRQQGVSPEALVGVFLERSVDMVVALLAVLKAGAAYLPLDPGYPKERLSYMIRDSKTSLVITTQYLSSQLPNSPAQIVAIDEMQELLASESGENLDNTVDTSNAAYVIYTSGSTGQPKGTVITHQNVVGLLDVTAEQFHFATDDVWTFFHSFAFDFSVWELFGALLHGGRLIVVPFWMTRSPETFYQLLVDQQVTVLNQTPSAFHQLVQCSKFSVAKTKLRYVIFGGEALDPATLQDWWANEDHEQVQLINMYGITETTVHVTYHVIAKDDDKLGRSIIGRPISNLQIFVLDANQKLLPLGMPGEIYVGGGGLARGYLARPGLTSGRFVPDAFSGAVGRRLYRSGDLARWLPDGSLDYLGRADHQVKIRGFRVELGEIESVLTLHPSVNRAAVVLAVKGQREGYLAAYVETSTTQLDLEEIRALAKQQLPEYMIPTRWVVMEKLPVLPNGKLDRNALPDPTTAETQSSHKPVLPKNNLERAVGAVWQDVLGREDIGTQDNFFDLGGHSLNAVQIHKQLTGLGFEVTILDLFTYPTIATLSDFLSGQITESSLDALNGQAAARKQHLQKQRQLQNNAREQILIAQ